MLWKDTFTRLGRRLHSTLGRPVVVVAIDSERTGGIAAHTRILGANYGEMEFAAKAILNDIERNMAKGEANADVCPCCVGRLERVRAALGLLEPNGSTPIDGADLRTRH